MLGALSASREGQYLAKQTGRPRYEYNPNIELIRASEVDPFKSNKQHGPAAPQDLKDISVDVGLKQKLEKLTPQQKGSIPAMQDVQSYNPSFAPAEAASFSTTIPTNVHLKDQVIKSSVITGTAADSNAIGAVEERLGKMEKALESTRSYYRRRVATLTIAIGMVSGVAVFSFFEMQKRITEADVKSLMITQERLSKSESPIRQLPERVVIERPFVTQHTEDINLHQSPKRKNTWSDVVKSWFWA
jgi:hypothetical protein